MNSKKRSVVVKTEPIKKNNKLGWYVVILLLLILFLILVVDNLNNSVTGKVIDPNNLEDPLGIGINPENVPETPEELANISTNYLKQEWTKILSNNKIGRVILQISGALTWLDFFWNPVFGMNYSLSWIFIFSFVIWVFFIVFFYQITKAVFSDRKLVAFIASFCIASIVGTAGVIKKVAEQLSVIVNNVWIAWISLGIALLIMFLVVKFGGTFKAYLEKQKENSEKDKTEKANKIIQTRGEIAKKELDTMK